MSDKDTYTKNYMSNNDVFADAFNFFVYNGEQIIKPENLKSLDTSSISIPFSQDNTQMPIQKIRDLLKIAEIKEDGKSIYLILGAENQSDIHFAMPARNMLYDALEYERQIKSIADRHKKFHDYKGISSGEFLSGFYKGDKLIPVITLCIYFGADEWDAPRSIYDMFEIEDEKLLSYVNDYHINLIVPNELTEEDEAKFHSNLKEVLLYIKNSNDKEKLRNLVKNNEKFSKLEREAVYVINACTNSNLKIDESQEVIDMCQAIEDIKEEGRLEGIQEGIQKGLEKGIISTVKICKELEVSFSDTIKKISSEFGLSEAEAKDSVNKFWN